MDFYTVRIHILCFDRKPSICITAPNLGIHAIGWATIERHLLHPGKRFTGPSKPTQSFARVSPTPPPLVPLGEIKQGPVLTSRLNGC